MSPVGYQEGNEKLWWWKVAMHIDEAQQALANAMAHNLEDQRPVFALQDKLREGQAILLDIFRAKGLLPAAPNGQNGQHGSAEGKIEEAIPVPMPVMSEPAVPEHMIVDAELVGENPVPAVAAEPPVTPAVDSVAVPAAPVAKPSAEPVVVEVLAAVKPTAAPTSAKPATPTAPASAAKPAAPAAAPAASAPSTPTAEASSEK